MLFRPACYLPDILIHAQRFLYYKMNQFDRQHRGISVLSRPCDSCTHGYGRMCDQHCYCSAKGVDSLGQPLPTFDALAYYGSRIPFPTRTGTPKEGTSSFCFCSSDLSIDTFISPLIVIRLSSEQTDFPVTRPIVVLEKFPDTSGMDCEV